ncbi:MAG TPA: hypothetical protein VGD33_11830 [Chitinophagaceae bacterium]
MSWFVKTFDFLLFSSIFIAICAVLMCYQTFILFDHHADAAILAFVFFATICSYNFHWYLTPSIYGLSRKIEWSFEHKKLHFLLFITGLIGSIYFGLVFIHHWKWLLGTALITFLYSAPKIPHPALRWLRNIALAKTIFLALVWTHVTVVLPIALSGLPIDEGERIFAINRFFLIYPICILFDYRDRKEDIKEGIRSMITDFSDRGIDILFWGSLFVFSGTQIILWLFYFNLPETIILLIPALILAFIYGSSKSNGSDYRFYLVLDGLMALSALILLLFHFI